MVAGCTLLTLHLLTPRPSKLEVPGDYRVLVLGAGVSGVAMGRRLGQLGLPYTVLEKGRSLGGTWRDNTYPGAACDVPSHLYSFSFFQVSWL